MIVRGGLPYEGRPVGRTVSLSCGQLPIHALIERETDLMADPDAVGHGGWQDDGSLSPPTTTMAQDSIAPDLANLRASDNVRPSSSFYN